jgi:hypothetical protein
MESDEPSGWKDSGDGRNEAYLMRISSGAKSDTEKGIAFAREHTCELGRNNWYVVINSALKHEPEEAVNYLNSEIVTASPSGRYCVLEDRARLLRCLHKAGRKRPCLRGTR